MPAADGRARSAAGASCLILLGLLLQLLSWPPGPLPWLALAADAPFLWLLFGAGRRWKRWVFLYALLHYAAGFWWLSEITWLQVLVASLFMTPIYLAAGVLLRLFVRRRVPWLLAVPTVLVFEEIVRTVYLGGMPLPSRALALSASPALNASAAYLGAYSLSFLAALVGAAVARAPYLLRARSHARAFVDGLVAAAVAGLLLAGGAYRLARAADRIRSSAPRVLVAVQGDVPQSLKHSPDPQAIKDMFDRHLDLSVLGIERALEQGEEVLAVLWPETMVPWELVDADLAARFPEVWENEVRILQNVRERTSFLARRPLFLLGAIYQYRRGEERHADLRAYGTHDSLFLVAPDEVPPPEPGYPPPPAPGLRPRWELGRHDKRILVPGGEYTPLGDLLPPLRLVRNLVSVIPELDPGEEGQPLFRLVPEEAAPGEPEVLAGTVICFELLSPAPCRDWRRRGAQVLLNAANYGWFGRTAFRAQIRAVARLRAAETAATVVVAGNTGPTLFYDPVGRPYGAFDTPEGAWRGDPESDETTFRPGVVRGPLLLDPEPTPYVAFGDLPWFALGIVVLGFGLLRRGAVILP